MSFTAPIGTEAQRATGKIWPGKWFDATGYDKLYDLGYHTGADLNLNFPHWDADAHSDVYAIGAGKVTYAKIYSTQVWGGIIIIDHGDVDGTHLFSRYGHVEDIAVSKGEKVETGEKIASVGNGEELFPYHLHFDISATEILKDSPGHWPGHNRTLVRMHYVNPQEWLQAHVTAVDAPPPPPSTAWFVIAHLGLRVRNNPGTSGTPVGVIPFGTRILLEDGANRDEGAYSWGKISGGRYDDDWVAIKKIDQSEVYLSQFPPSN